MTTELLPLRDRAVLDRARRAVDHEALAVAAEILATVQQRGDTALADFVERFEERRDGQPSMLDQEALDRELAAASGELVDLMRRTASRIAAFASAQRASLETAEVDTAGLSMGHRILAVERAGCYAPGGRYPYPSSVLMTAVTARVAGVKSVVVASPNPSRETVVAAAVAGADALLCAGGAQAIAALAYGTETIAPCDAIVGPGNRFVTAAKQLIAGEVRIDGLAGPSELVVFADASASPQFVAADLIAQAEHDVDARCILVTTEAGLATAVRAELERQLADLETATTARPALAQGFCVVVPSLSAGAEVCNDLAPEHLQVVLERPDTVLGALINYGGLFVGDGAAEVFGDYGAGPNHVLPTGRTSRSVSGLSVLTFLRTPTQMRALGTGPDPQLVEDAINLARIEGLEGHARAAALRRIGRN